jgi:vitamin K-dependent gamma-carboxylase
VHYVRDEFRRTHGIAQPEVYANVYCSLNGEPEQRLIDATVDLAAEEQGLGVKQWIRPRLIQRPRRATVSGSQP